MDERNRRFKIKVLIISFASLLIVMALSVGVWWMFLGKDLNFNNADDFITEKVTNTPITTSEEPASTQVPTQTNTPIEKPIISESIIDSTLICIDNGEKILLESGKTPEFIDTMSDLDIIKDAYNNEIITLRYTCFKPLYSSNLPYLSKEMAQEYTHQINEYLNEGKYSEVNKAAQQIGSQYRLDALDYDELNAMITDANLLKNMTDYLTSNNNIIDYTVLAKEVNERLLSSQALISLYFDGCRDLLINNETVNASLPSKESLIQTDMSYEIETVEYVALDPTAIGYKIVNYESDNGIWKAVFGMHEKFMTFISFEQIEQGAN